MILSPSFSTRYQVTVALYSAAAAGFRQHVPPQIYKRQQRNKKGTFFNQFFFTRDNPPLKINILQFLFIYKFMLLYYNIIFLIKLIKTITILIVELDNISSENSKILLT